MKRVAGVVLVLGLAGCGPQQAARPVDAAPAVVASASASATPAAIATATDTQAPPMVNGMYVQKGACPGEGCYFGRMQATAEMPLYAAPGAAPVAIGKVAKDEWLDTVTTEDHFAPMKGAVTADAPPLKTGDVVYRLGYGGEGCFDVWDKGEHASWCDDGATPPSGIAWDKASAKEDGSQGLWVQVTRAAGPGGWLRDPKDLRCIGYQDRDADCPPLPAN